jgi:hypothetical protein
MYSNIRAFLAILLAVSLAAPSPAQSSRVVPRGTVVKLILNDRLHTDETEVGDEFEATIAEDVVINGRDLLERGAVVEGVVAAVEESERLAGLSGRASMTLRFDRVRMRGRDYPIAATLISVHDPVGGLDAEDIEEDDDIDIDEEGELEAENDLGGIITRGAIGVAAGALLGALFGNVSRGVLLGSIGGAIAILAPKGEDLILEEGTGLRIRLDRDLQLATT